MLWVLIIGAAVVLAIIAVAAGVLVHETRQRALRAHWADYQAESESDRQHIQWIRDREVIAAAERAARARSNYKNPGERYASEAHHPRRQQRDAKRWH